VKQACIQEALRLHPPVPLIARVLQNPIEIDGMLTCACYHQGMSLITFSGAVIPKGTEVDIVPYAIHRHPEFWNNPNEFIPERFLGSAASNRHPFSYIPFSAGPRNCIGKRFAMLELLTSVAMITREFRLHILNDDVLGDPSLILRPFEGLYVSVTTRENEE